MLPSRLNICSLEAGCDEAGRGCLAGPVYAAAVILPHDFSDPRLNDSKKLTERRRLELVPVIKEHAIAWAIARVEANEIDHINILNASILAMHRALDQIADSGISPESLVIDGNRFKPWRDIPYQTVVHGDARLADIAAASILAKTARDQYMKTIAEDFPMYNWEINKGYPTRDHREAIARYGVSPHHRLSFRLLPPPTIPGLE